MFSFCLFRLYLLNIFKHTGVWMCTPVWGLLIFLDRLSIHSVSVCYLPQNSWLHSPWDQGNEFFPFIWAALTLNAEDCCWFLISKLEGRYNLSWKIFFFSACLLSCLFYKQSIRLLCSSDLICRYTLWFSLFSCWNFYLLVLLEG